MRGAAMLLHRRAVHIARLWRLCGGRMFHRRP